MINLIDRRRITELRWINERRGHVPVIDRRTYPPITENSDPIVRNFGGGDDSIMPAARGKTLPGRF
jgi:hypothetical protein